MKVPIEQDACILLNPAAGRGKSGRRFSDVKKAFARIGVAEVFETVGQGDEKRLALAACDRGFRTIVVAGGDGTCARVADAILKSDIPCRLALIPTGTGNDFAKTLGVDGYALEQIAGLVVRGDATQIDVGFADGYYFLNSCGFGFDASVLEASSRVRFLTGDAVYVYSALRQLFSYRGVKVSTNGGVDGRRMLMVTVSNGRFLGGVFKIAPHASVLDGRLDACFIGDSNVVDRVKLFVGAMRGSHLAMRSVAAANVQELALTFAGNPLMEMDGELRRANSATVELKCIPRALSVIAAPGALA